MTAPRRDHQEVGASGSRSADGDGTEVAAEDHSLAEALRQRNHDWDGLGWDGKRGRAFTDLLEHLPAVLGGRSIPVDLGREDRFYRDSQRTALATMYDECAASAVTARTPGANSITRIRGHSVDGLISIERCRYAASIIDGSTTRRSSCRSTRTPGLETRHLPTTHTGRVAHTPGPLSDLVIPRQTR